MPKISIIMNCYNSDTYLKEALDSVISQSYDNWELIFWDNHSTDHSAEIVKSYHDNRIRYFYATEHTYLSKARNKAVEKAEGEWLAFLDCDDLWEKDKLKLSMTELEKNSQNQVGLIYSKSIVINSAGNKSFTVDTCISGKINNKLLINGNFIVNSSIIVNKKYFYEMNGIDESLTFCTDYDLLLKITRKYYSIGINAYLTKYRVHESNISSTKIFKNSLEVIELLKKYMKENSLPIDIRKRIFVKNSSRIGFLFIELFKRKEYKNNFRVVFNYLGLLIFSPLAILSNKIYKNFNS